MNIFEVYEQLASTLKEKQAEYDKSVEEIKSLTEIKTNYMGIINNTTILMRETETKINNKIFERDITKAEIEKKISNLEKLDIWSIIEEIASSSPNKEIAKKRFVNCMESGFTDYIK